MPDKSKLEELEFPTPEQFNSMTDAEKKCLIAAIRKCNKQLEAEIKILKCENENLENMLYGPY